MGSDRNIIVYLCRFLKILRQRVDPDFGSEYNGVVSCVLTKKIFFLPFQTICRLE